jgi:hypothetical protein
MGRRVELDAVRGLMLVWITLTHLPTAASTHVNQPFGFISAAEGFIFLSALFTGRIYYRMAEHDGYRAMSYKLWMRTLRLYGYHALLLAFAFLVAVPIAARGNRPGLHNLLDFYFTAGPRQSIVEAALLIYRPPLLDILPMYIIFLVFTSAALLLERRIGWKPIFYAALALWLFAQFGFRQAEHSLVSHFIPLHIPMNQIGAFDLWAWQLLWIIGIWMGVRWAKGDLPIEIWAKRLVIPSMLLVSAFFELRHAINNGLQLGPYEFLFDKWHLGVLRLINFAAVAALLIHSQTLWKPFAIKPLIMLGQSSLQVFCVHVLFCFAGLTLMGNASMLSGWHQFALLTVTFSAMLATAKLFGKSEAKQERQPKSQAKSQCDPTSSDDHSAGSESQAQKEETLSPLEGAGGQIRISAEAASQAAPSTK